MRKFRNHYFKTWVHGHNQTETKIFHFRFLISSRALIHERSVTADWNRVESNYQIATATTDSARRSAWSYANCSHVIICCFLVLTFFAVTFCWLRVLWLTFSETVNWNLSPRFRRSFVPLQLILSSWSYHDDVTSLGVLSSTRTILWLDSKIWSLPTKICHKRLTNFPRLPFLEHPSQSQLFSRDTEVKQSKRREESWTESNQSKWESLPWMDGEA